MTRAGVLELLARRWHLLWALFVITFFAWMRVPALDLPLPWGPAETPGPRLVIGDPRWLIVAIVAPLPTLVRQLQQSTVHGVMPLGWLVLAVRLLTLSGLAGAVAQPRLLHHARPVAHMIAVDVSASVDDAALSRVRAQIQTLEQRRDREQRESPLDPLRVAQPTTRGLRFASTLAPRSRLDADALTDVRDLTPVERDGTRLAEAIQLAATLAPAGSEVRISAVTDGRISTPSARALQQVLTSLDDDGVAVRWVQMPASSAANVGIRAVRVPSGIRVGRTFEVEAELFSTHGGTARLSLLPDASLASTAPPRQVELTTGRNVVSLQTRARQDGALILSVVADEIRLDGGDDAIAEDNALTAVAAVARRPTVLVLTEQPRSHLAAALEADALAVTTLSPRALERASLQRDLDLLILEDVPASAIDPALQRQIVAQVDEEGLGLMMVGGPRSYGPGGWQGTPIYEALPIRVEGQRQREIPGVALMLVLDKSGSMGVEDKLGLVKEAARAAAATLRGSDQIGVIAFDSRPQSLVRLQPASSRLRIASDIRRVQAGGGTNVLPALREAFFQLAGSNASVKHVIVLSDGQSPERGVLQVVQQMRDANMTVSSVGVGSDAGKGLLRRVAREGRGRYYFSLDGSDVPRIFQREAREAAKNSIVEEPRQIRVRKSVQAFRGVAFQTAPPVEGLTPFRRRTNAELLLDTSRGEPLLVRGRYGLGRTYAFASDAGPRWSTRWLEWGSFAKFWAQVARDAARPGRDSTAGASMQVTREASLGTWEVRVDVRDGDRYVSDLEGTVTVENPAARSTADAPAIPLVLDAPGHYRATLAEIPAGSRLLRAALHRRGDAEQRISATAVTTLPSARSEEAESLLTPPDPAIASLFNRLGAGVVDDLNAPWPARNAQTSAYARAPLSAFALWALALPCFLLDLLLRRWIAWRGIPRRRSRAPESA